MLILITILFIFLFIDMLGITLFGLPWNGYIQDKIDEIFKWWVITGAIIVAAMVICFIILLV